MKYFWRITVLILFSSAFFTAYGIGKKDSVMLRGMVYNDKDRVKNVVIKIYENNILFRKIQVKSSNRFTTNLPVNKKLTIEISGEGYFPKRFIFDTTVPDDLKIIPNYQFDIDIFKEEELEGVNTSFLDFPVGLVSYDQRKEAFIRNKKYTKQMKKAYLKLWGKSQSLKRSGFENEEEVDEEEVEPEK